MANPEHLQILQQGFEAWYQWREQNEDIRPDFSDANLSDANVRVLNLSTPGGFEAYIRELAAAWAENGGPPTIEAVGRLASRYDVEVVGPPLHD